MWAGLCTAGGGPFPHFYKLSGDSPESHKGGASGHRVPVYLSVRLPQSPARGKHETAAFSLLLVPGRAAAK